MPPITPVIIQEPMLSALATAAARDMLPILAWPRLAPEVSISSQEFKYPLWPKELLVPDEKLVGTGERPLYGKPQFVNITNVLVSAIAKEISFGFRREQKREIERGLQAGLPSILEADGMAAVRNCIYDIEKKVYAVIQGSANTTTVLAGSKWDDYLSATSDPIGDVKTAAALIYADTGVPQRDLTGCCNQACFLALSQHPQILQHFQGAVVSTDLTPEQIARALRIKDLVVIEMASITAANILAATWGNKFGLTYANTAAVGDKIMAVPTAMRVAKYQDLQIVSAPLEPLSDTIESKAMIFMAVLTHNADMTAIIETPLT